MAQTTLPALDYPVGRALLIENATRGIEGDERICIVDRVSLISSCKRRYSQPTASESLVEASGEVCHMPLKSCPSAGSGKVLEKVPAEALS